MDDAEDDVDSVIKTIEYNEKYEQLLGLFLTKNILPEEMQEFCDILLVELNKSLVEIHNLQKIIKERHVIVLERQ